MGENEKEKKIFSFLLSARKVSEKGARKKLRGKPEEKEVRKFERESKKNIKKKNFLRGNQRK